MEYVFKHALAPRAMRLKEIKGAKYFDDKGVLQPGHSCHWEMTHFALFALFGWLQQNPSTSPMLSSLLNLQMRSGKLISYKTKFTYEVQICIAMMNHDHFNKGFKAKVLELSLKEQSTSLKEQDEKATLMKREQKRIFDIREMSSNEENRFRWAAAYIQQWWLYRKRKYRIYMNVYQLTDQLIKGFDSENFVRAGKHEILHKKHLLKIQEGIMTKIAARRTQCYDASKQWGAIFKDETNRIAERISTQTVLRKESGSRWKTFMSIWARRLGLTKT